MFVIALFDIAALWRNRSTVDSASIIDVVGTVITSVVLFLWSVAVVGAWVVIVIMLAWVFHKVVKLSRQGS